MAVFQLPKGGWTALMYAARQNAMEAAAALADVHADLNATTKQEGTTALQIAVINIHYDLANVAARERRGSERRGQQRHDGALRSRRHARAREHADPAGAEAARQARRARHHHVVARARRESEHSAEEAHHRPPSESGRRRPVDGRLHCPGARSQSERYARHEGAARRRGGRDAHARQSQHDGDSGSWRPGARAGGAPSREAARRPRRRRERVQHQRPDARAHCRAARTEFDDRVPGGPGCEARSPRQAGPHPARPRARRQRSRPGAGPAARPAQVNEKTAALLRELLAQNQTKP